MPESIVDLIFPMGGVDLSAGLTEQDGGTTTNGINVRAFEPSTGRGRGGSRAGLVKYVLGRVANTSATANASMVEDDDTLSASGSGPNS